jgi:hypothetical protein
VGFPTKTFAEEYGALLKRHRIEFDERYLLDRGQASLRDANLLQLAKLQASLRDASFLNPR